jgi:hypothetical protein
MVFEAWNPIVVAVPFFYGSSIEKKNSDPVFIEHSR